MVSRQMENFNLWELVKVDCLHDAFIDVSLQPPVCEQDVEAFFVEILPLIGFYVRF